MTVPGIQIYALPTICRSTVLSNVSLDLNCAGCLEEGYEDYQQIREDPDLEGVRGDSRFQSLISKYAKSNGNGFFGNMLKGFNL